jgi:hypothetical protein
MGGDAVAAQLADLLGQTAADQNAFDAGLSLAHQRHDLVDQPARRIEIGLVAVTADEGQTAALPKRARRRPHRHRPAHGIGQNAADQLVIADDKETDGDIRLRIFLRPPGDLPQIDQIEVSA